MPQLPSANIADVSAGRTGDGVAVCADVLHVWDNTADFQVFDIWLPAAHLDRDRYFCANPPRCGELVWFRHRPGIRDKDNPLQFSWFVLSRCLDSDSQSPADSGGPSGRGAWCGVWKFDALGRCDGVQTRPTPGRHGNGRRQNDGYGGGVLGSARSIPHYSLWHLPRQCLRHPVDRSALLERLETTAGESWGTPPTRKRECTALGHRFTVPTSTRFLPWRGCVSGGLLASVGTDKVSRLEPELS